MLEHDTELLSKFYKSKNLPTPYTVILEHTQRSFIHSIVLENKEKLNKIFMEFSK